MKITFILPGINLSGGTKVVLIYAQELAKLGHEVVLISPPPPQAFNSRKARRLINGGKRQRRISNSILFSRGYVLRLSRLSIGGDRSSIATFRMAMSS